jgi:hypothetical protein
MDNLGSIFNWLDGLEYGPDWESVGKTFAESLTPEAICQYLDEVLADVHDLCELHKRSYVHPLGFHKFELYQSPSTKGFSVRLHYWPPESRMQNEDIHDHCFHFYSKILLGNFRHVLYREQPDGIRHEKYLYSIDEDFRSTKIWIGSRHLVTKEYISAASGDFYSMNANTLHSVKESRHQRISVILRTPYIKHRAKVYEKENRHTDLEYSRSPESISSINEFGKILQNMSHEIRANNAMQGKNSALRLRFHSEFPPDGGRYK